MKEALDREVVPLNLTRRLKDGSEISHDADSLVQVIRGIISVNCEVARFRASRKFMRAGTAALKDEFLKKLGHPPKYGPAWIEEPGTVVPQHEKRKGKSAGCSGSPADETGMSNSRATAIVNETPDRYLTASEGVSRDATGSKSAPKVRTASGSVPTPGCSLLQDDAKGKKRLRRSEGELQSDQPILNLRKDGLSTPSDQWPPGMSGSERTLGPFYGPTDSDTNIALFAQRRQATVNGPPVQNQVPAIGSAGQQGMPEKCIYLGAFTVPSNEIRKIMVDIQQGIEQAVESEFDISGIERAEPADFELKPTLELQKLYQTMLGAKDWKAVLSPLQEERKPRAFDALFALVAAELHLKVLDGIQAWQGAKNVNFGSALRRRLVADTVKKHAGIELDTLLRLAAVRELSNREYGCEEMIPEARRLATDFSLIGAQHLGRLRRRASPSAPSSFEEQWKSRMKNLFFMALHLAARLRLASEQYVSKWYSSGDTFEGGAMESRYPLDKPETVCMSLFPALHMHSTQAGSMVVSQGLVIADQRKS